MDLALSLGLVWFLGLLGADGKEKYRLFLKGDNLYFWAVMKMFLLCIEVEVKKIIICALICKENM